MRRGWRWIAVCLLSGLVAVLPVHAEEEHGRIGAFAFSQTETGPADSTNTVQVDGAYSLVVEYEFIAGTAMIEIQRRLIESTVFFPVPGTKSTQATLITIVDPVGVYKARLIQCNACTVSVKFNAPRTRYSRTQ